MLLLLVIWRAVQQCLCWFQNNYTRDRYFTTISTSAPSSKSLCTAKGAHCHTLRVSVPTSAAVTPGGPHWTQLGRTMRPDAPLLCIQREATPEVKVASDAWLNWGMNKKG